MAISYSFKWLPLLLAAASLITIASADQALINSICGNTRNQTLCQQIFNHSVNADRAGLGQISTDVALQKIHKSLNLIKRLDHDKANIKTKYQYDSCLDLYASALYNLKECKLRFGVHDFDDASATASGVLTDINTCLEEAPSAPPQLTAAIQEYEDYLCIVLEVAYVPRNT